jgi:hypothetical protein
VITGVECFHPDFEELDTESELVILYRLLSAFGPLPEALIKHVNDEEAGTLLEGLWQAIAKDESNETFKRWSEKVFPNLNDEAKEVDIEDDKSQSSEKSINVGYHDGSLLELSRGVFTVLICC